MTTFEKVSSVLNGTECSELRENCIYWCDGDKYATVNVMTNSRYASRIRKLAEKYPDDVKIFSEAVGVIVAGVPTSFIKISKRELGEDHKQKLLEAGKAWRESSQSLS